MNRQMLQDVTASVIAIMSIAIAGFIVVVDVIQNRPITDVPVWLGLLIGAVVGAYFSQHASVNGARQAGVAAAQSAISAQQAAEAVKEQQH